MATNYKQNDPRWVNYPYAGESMGPAGCGPTATADVLDKSPVEIANWMTNHGYASNGSGTYQAGITAAIRAYGYSASQLTNSSKAGVMNDPSFETFKASIQQGNCGILLMGGLRTGCRNSYWSNAGHFIAIVGYSNGKYLVYDPAYAARDGYHDFYDFQGNIKHVYTTNIRWTGKQQATTSNNSSISSSFKTIGTATCTDDSVNVRSTPGGTIIGQAGKGNRFEVDGNISGDWVHIKITGIGIGYMHKDYVKYDSKVATTTASVKQKTATSSNGNSYSFNPSQIKIGDNNVSVLLAQEILKARGIYTGGLDRSFGPLMDKAVRAYQKQRKLTVDGICGPATWKDLLGK